MKRSDCMGTFSQSLYLATDLKLTMHTTIAFDRIVNHFEVWSEVSGSNHFRDLESAIERFNAASKELEAVA